MVEAAGVEDKKPSVPERSEKVVVDQMIPVHEPAAPKSTDPAEAQAEQDMFEQLKRKYASH